ncbi:MAG: tRNA (adenosine(37)-N6)-threonylcarbamoyltransferase complex dimerization subunit type 1 TsaB [Mycoplasmatales bacterium]
MNLFISTATDKIYLMTFDNEKVNKTIIHQGNNDHTTSFYDLINEIIPKLSDVKKIYIVNGPGSYTGLRVGVIFAKTMGIELNVDLYPINLLEVLYATNHHNIAVDAKGKKYYIYNGVDHRLIATDLLEEDYLVDPLIDLEELVNSDILKNAEKVDALELGVNYVKSAI